MRAIADRLGHPEQAFRSVHVAGTNGKGSVTAMVDAGLRAAGHLSARYTSPHLVDLTEAIDAIVRRSGGFPMGPFELQDLVGLDVGLDISMSFAALSFGEPRWRPSPLSARMVAAGRLGRKSGHGFYAYGEINREGK